MNQLYRHILIATDFSESAEHGVILGADLAQRFGARVTLLHAYDAGVFERSVAPLQMGRKELEQQMAETARAELERIAALRFADAEGIDCVAIGGDVAALAIVDHAKKHEVDLCVVGTHGRTGLRRVLAGSVAERVVRHASCDVLVVRATPSVWPPTRIVTGTDFSEASQPAVSRAGALATTFGAKLTLAYVFDSTIPIALPNGTFESLEHAETRLRAQLEDTAVTLNVKAETKVVRGSSAALALCHHADEEDVDMMVVGTHGRTGLAQLMVGSVAERVVRHGPAATLIVHTGPKATAT